MATKQLYSANHYHRLSFGDYGFRLLDEDNTTSTAVGENFCTVHVLKDAVISLSSNLDAGDSSITDLDLNNAIDAMEKRKINSHEYSEYEDRYQPLALFSFIFLMVSFLLPTSKMEKIK